MKKNMKIRTILDAVQGARRAETGMYVVIHEDFEYRATPQCAQIDGFASF